MLARAFTPCPALLKVHPYLIIIYFNYLQNSRKSGCLKYLAISPTCSEKYLQLDAKDDGSGRQHWIITPVKTPAVSPPPRKSPPPPPQFVEVPAVNYSIAFTGYTPQTFGPSEKIAFCNSILNSTTYPKDWMRCVITSVTNVPFNAAAGRRLMQGGSVYVRGYTAFEFIYGNGTSQQQATTAANGLFKEMGSPNSLQTIFQPSFNSSTIAPDAVDRGQIGVPENTLPTPSTSPSPAPASPSPIPSSPSPSPTSPSPSPSPSTPALSPQFNTISPSQFPEISSPVPVPVPVPGGGGGGPTPTPTPVPAPPPAYPTYGNAYISNSGDNTITYCGIAGAVVNSCSIMTVATGGFNTAVPTFMAVSGSTLYIANYVATYITQCNNVVGNTASNCAVSTTYTGAFSGASGMAITGLTIYVTNANSNTLAKCTLASVGGSITSCSIATPNTGGFNLSGPRGVAILGQNMYVTSTAGNNVVKCTLVPDGSSIISCAVASPTMNSPYGIGFYGTFVYITNQSTNAMTKCTVEVDGTFSNCAAATPATGGFNFNLPSGLKISGSTIFVTNILGVNSLIRCGIADAAGSISSCSVATPNTGGFNMNQPIGMVLN